MSTKIIIYSDYVCPFCYVGQSAVDRLVEEYDVEIDWRPFEIHPETPLESRRLSESLRESFGGTVDWLKERAENEGLKMIFPPMMANTRRALEASEYAREQDLHTEFHEVVFRNYYAEGKNINDWEVLRDAADAVGLNPDEMQQKTERGKYKETLDSQLAKGHDLGITGVPTYVIDNKYAIVGAQPYEVFENAMEQLGTNKKEINVSTI